jgi:predicted AlkP superfamily pyrophosphatase or phosphodiesterase
MYPIFIGHGPSFKKNFTIKSFNNVDIYPLMCYLLGIEPSANNGSLDNVLDMIIITQIESKLNNSKYNF